MASKNNEKSGKENQEKENELESVRALLAFKGQYHHHKETMAHAAIVIQLGILTLIINMDCWPLLDNCHKVAVLIGYVLMWALISGYMLWQLDNRREAAHQVDELIELLEDKAEDDKVRKVINHMKGRPEGPKIGACILWTSDVLILIIALLRMFVPW